MLSKCILQYTVVHHGVYKACTNCQCKQLRQRPTFQCRPGL